MRGALRREGLLPWARSRFSGGRGSSRFLLDLHLPDMGGTVLKALQADADTADIPVIVMSADATPSQARALLTTGAWAYLTKPLDVREFLAVISEHLNPPETPR